MAGLLALSVAGIVTLVGLFMRSAPTPRVVSAPPAQDARSAGNRPAVQPGASTTVPPGQNVGGTANRPTIQRGGNTTVTVTDDPFFGDILTDERGRTLYRLEPDFEGGVRDCFETNGCAAEWPPLIVSGALTRPAALPGQLTTRRRANGSQQAVYNGWPLYRNVNDDEPGDSSGDNETDEWGSWFVVMLDERPPDPTPTLPAGSR